MANIQEIGQELAEEFDLFDDSMDRYEYIIELGKLLPPLNEVHKVEANVVKGCQSTVWLTASLSDEKKVIFEADSNTLITKGIIAILIKVLSEQTPKAILADDFSFIDAIQLRSHLSSQRSNGLSAMLQRMQNFARHFQQQLA